MENFGLKDHSFVDPAVNSFDTRNKKEELSKNESPIFGRINIFGSGT